MQKIFLPFRSDTWKDRDRVLPDQSQRVIAGETREPFPAYQAAAAGRCHSRTPETKRGGNTGDNVGKGRSRHRVRVVVVNMNTPVLTAAMCKNRRTRKGPHPGLRVLESLGLLARLWRCRAGNVLVGNRLIRFDPASVDQLRRRLCIQLGGRFLPLTSTAFRRLGASSSLRASSSACRRIF